MDIAQCDYGAQNLRFFLTSVQRLVDMLSPRRRIPKVALLIETTRTYTRELLSGIRRYIAAHGPWSSFIELRALDSAPPEWLRNWDGDGIISRTYTQEMADLIDQTGLPAVELRSTHFAGKRPFVGMDNSQIGKIAAEHLLNHGYREFGVYNLHAELFFEERVRNFVTTIKEHGCLYDELSEETSEKTSHWENTQKRLMDWIASLPKPVGIFAANDQLAVRILDACQRLDIGVPEDVAVVGAENEETLCAFATPPLSSVQLDGAAVGFLAAQLLDQLMKGHEAPQQQTLVAPKGLMIRESSDAFVIHDRLVAQAARIIRENANAGINVEDLCLRLNASRSTLDRRMKAALNRSPKEEISRVRFREIERLLRETDLTIDAIAEHTGFAHSHYLQAAYKEFRGMTPGQFRAQFQPRDRFA